MYGFITNRDIRSMRNSARLTVGQVSIHICNTVMYMYTQTLVGTFTSLHIYAHVFTYNFLFIFNFL